MGLGDVLGGWREGHENTVQLLGCLCVCGPVWLFRELSTLQRDHRPGTKVEHATIKILLEFLFVLRQGLVFK